MLRHQVDRSVVSAGVVDDDWDEFVDAAGGSHQQSTLWARVKRLEGWSAYRVKVYDGSEITGGCQVLTRPVGGVGSVAFAPRGPIVDGGRDDVLDLVLSRMTRAARRRRAVYLRVQPPARAWPVLQRLDQLGYLPSSTGLPEAVARVDLGSDMDVVLARMAQSTRRYIRMAARKGVTVRAGDRDDLDTLWRCLSATAQRQRFEVFRLSYYQRMWDVFTAAGRAQLLIAAHEGRPLSAILLLGMGDTVEFKTGGWSGEGGDLHPNEAVHWAGMQWAKSQGYSWYDFEGIDRKAAAALLDGRADRSATRGVTRFKLGFGGEVCLLPAARHRSPWPAMTSVLDRLEHTKSVKVLGNRLAGRRASTAAGPPKVEEEIS
jgi:peptidoglycan pentaglycine glycine transferase (the first glycine)